MDYQQAYADLMLADKISLRERLVMHFSERGYAILDCIKNAEILGEYIQAGINPWPNLAVPAKPKTKKATKPKVAKKKRGRPPKPPQTIMLAPGKKKKRKYTKRSQHWRTGRDDSQPA